VDAAEVARKAVTPARGASKGQRIASLARRAGVVEGNGMKGKVVSAGVAAVVILGGAVLFSGRKKSPPAAPEPLAWQECRTEDGRFRMRIPGTPRRRKETRDAGVGPAITSTLVEVVREDLGAKFCCHYFDLPGKMEGEGLLDASCAQQCEALQGKALAVEKRPVAGHPGRTFGFEFGTPDGAVHDYKGRLFVAEDRYYCIYAITPRKSGLHSAAAAFVESLRRAGRGRE
jgi:hypothetical protein